MLVHVAMDTGCFRQVAAVYNDHCREVQFNTESQLHCCSCCSQVEMDSNASNGEVYLTPPETPNGVSAVTSESRQSSDTEGEHDSKKFVRRSSRKRSATEFFHFEVSHEVEMEEPKPKKSRKRKPSEGSATPSRSTAETVRRSLVFSETTPEKSSSKMKLDSNKSTVPNEEPVNGELASIEEEEGSMEEEICAPPFSIGTLVFGKLKGYDWWPGRVASHNEIGMPVPPPNHSWIRWYGENQVSDVSESYSCSLHIWYYNCLCGGVCSCLKHFYRDL